MVEKIVQRLCCAVFVKTSLCRSPSGTHRAGKSYKSVLLAPAQIKTLSSVFVDTTKDKQVRTTTPTSFLCTLLVVNDADRLLCVLYLWTLQRLKRRETTEVVVAPARHSDGVERYNIHVPRACPEKQCLELDAFAFHFYLFIKTFAVSNKHRAARYCSMCNALVKK